MVARRSGLILKRKRPNYGTCRPWIARSPSKGSPCLNALVRHASFMHNWRYSLENRLTCLYSCSCSSTNSLAGRLTERPPPIRRSSLLPKMHRAPPPHQRHRGKQRRHAPPDQTSQPRRPKDAPRARLPPRATQQTDGVQRRRLRPE